MITAPEKLYLTQPDLALAYASLAPLVTEALAFMTCERYPAALDSLRKAKGIIDQATMIMAVLE